MNRLPITKTPKVYVGGAFIRIYSRDEICALFRSAGLEIMKLVHPLILGEGVGGVPIRRGLAVAIKRR